MEKGKYKHKVSISCGLWDAFRDFRKKHKVIYPDINREKYVNVCYLINQKISDKIIKESFEFKMPGKLGVLSIRKNKLKIFVKDGKLQKNKMIIDWGKTWEYWLQEYPGLTRKEINALEGKTPIYNMNEHSNGYIMRWHWDKLTCGVKNQTVYYFKPTKRNRLELASWIKSDDKENDYYLSTRRTFAYKQILKESKNE